MPRCQEPSRGTGARQVEATREIDSAQQRAVQEEDRARREREVQQRREQRAQAEAKAAQVLPSTRALWV